MNLEAITASNYWKVVSSDELLEQSDLFQFSEVKGEEKVWSGLDRFVSTTNASPTFTMNETNVLPTPIGGAIPSDLSLLLTDNFGKGVCTATEKAGKQFRLLIHNPELKDMTLHFGTKFSIFQKGQWPGTEGITWFNSSNAMEPEVPSTENDYFLDIEVMGIPLKKNEKAIRITHCTSGYCRSSKSHDGNPLCLFTKKDANAIKFNGNQPFIPIGFRCAPSYHDSEYFILRITLTNAPKTKVYSADHPVRFIHAKSKNSTSNVAAPDIEFGKEEIGTGKKTKRSRSVFEAEGTSDSSLPTAVHIHRLVPAIANPAGGSWICIEGTGFSFNSSVLMSHDNQPLESYLLTVSNSRLLFQAPPGKTGQTLSIYVSDGVHSSNSLTLDYQSEGKQKKNSLVKFLIFFFL